MRAGEQYAGGLCLHFFDSMAFESHDVEESKEQARRIARNILRLVMMGWQGDWTKLVSWRVFKAVFYERDAELTQGLRLAFQEGFAHVYRQLRRQTLTLKQHRQAQLFINNCLMFFPYADPHPFEIITIPQWLDGAWRQVDYKIVPIELTSSHGIKKIVLSEYDRVFAYGLEPISHTNATPHLIFMGTTYPAGQGFFSTIHTDLEAFNTAGRALYLSGRENIARWLALQKQKVQVCGTSLGGALALLLAIDQGDRLMRVDALNPPGLHQHWFRACHLDRWHLIRQKPEVFIQRQGDDPISKFGVWKTDWHLMHVISPKNRQGFKPFIDHALNHAGFAETQFVGIDVVADNRLNHRRNILLYSLVRSCVYYLSLIPLRYGGLPIGRYAMRNKLETLLLLGLLFVFLVSTSELSFSSVFEALMSIMGIAYLCTLLILFLSDQITGRCESDLTHCIAYLRDNKNIKHSALILSTSAGIMPLMGIISPEALTMLPAVASLCSKTSKAIVYAMNHGHKQVPDCHQASINRHPAIDAYSKCMKTEFTYEALHTYYRAKRCVLKQKTFVPKDDKSPRFFSSKEGWLSKQAVLSTVDKPKETLVCTVTLAKKYEMNRTLNLVARYGLYSHELREGVKDNYEQYLQGKLSACRF